MYLEMMSFALHKGQLENWKALSNEVNEDIKKADGFISRDSGIDEDKRVYCLIKWQSKTHQENFIQALTSGENWDEMQAHFSSIANMETVKNQHLSLF